MYPSNQDFSAWNLDAVRGPPPQQQGFGGGYPSEPQTGYPAAPGVGSAYPMYQNSDMGGATMTGFPTPQPDSCPGLPNTFGQPTSAPNYFPPPQVNPNTGPFNAGASAFNQAPGLPGFAPNPQPTQMGNSYQGFPSANTGYGSANSGYPSAGSACPSANSGYPSGSVVPGFNVTRVNQVYGTAGPAPHEDIICPTLKPYPNFNAEEDCEKLRRAMKGLGTDEAAIIAIMCHRSAEQRAKIVLQFKTMYGKDLIKEFKSELSGKFYQGIEALCYSPEEFDALQLRKATKGAGTDEDALIEILCSRTNSQIKKIKEAYARLFPGRSLEKDVRDDTSRHFRRILVSLLQANRDESLHVDRTLARRDAEELYKAGEKRLGTDESKFNMILASKSFAHLKVVFEEYSKISKRDIEAALKSEMSGDLLRSFLAIVRVIENKPKYFARLLKASMKGLGTDDRTLIRIVISRCEIDMGKIKEEFLKENGKTLESWITDDTSGDYRKMLLALVSGN